MRKIIITLVVGTAIVLGGVTTARQRDRRTARSGA